jgi:hypothetical protein
MLHMMECKRERERERREKKPPLTVFVDSLPLCAVFFFLQWHFENVWFLIG